MKEIVFEAREGGEVYELTADGKKGHRASVLEIRAAESDRAHVEYPRAGGVPTEVEVRFTPEGDTTRVDLEHRGWETVAENREAKRDNYDAGWDYVLGCYGRRAG